MGNFLKALVNVVAKALALICAVLFVVTALGALVLFNVAQQLLNPAPYKQALAQQHIYERLPALVAADLTASVEEAGEEALPFSFASQEDFERILSDLLSPQWLREQAEQVINQLFAYLASDDEKASLVISLAEVKERLTGPPGTEAILRLVRSWPPCSMEELSAWQSLAATGEPPQEMPTCRPPEEMMDEVAAFIPQITAQMAAEIPDALDLVRTSDSEGVARDPRPAFRAARLAAALSPLVPLGFLLLVGVFGVRSWRGFLNWWGVPLLVVGLVGLGMAGAIVPIFQRLLVAYSGQLADMPPSMVTIAAEVGRALAAGIALRVGVASLVLVLAGLVMLIVAGRGAARGSRLPS